jgi:uncharacterized protein
LGRLRDGDVIWSRLLDPVERRLRVLAQDRDLRMSRAALDVPVWFMAEPRHYQQGWQELTKTECFGLLARQRVGRIAVIDDLGPLVFPVNYVLDRHMVVFRTDEGTKLDAAWRGSPVAFEIDEIDALSRTGWSVLVRGEAIEVTDPAELERLRELPIEPWAPGAKAHYARILPAAVTGRRISATRTPSGGRVGPPPDKRDPA